MAREVYILHIFECIAGNPSKETSLPLDKDDNDDGKNEALLWKRHMGSWNGDVFNKIYKSM